MEVALTECQFILDYNNGVESQYTCSICGRTIKRVATAPEQPIVVKDGDVCLHCEFGKREERAGQHLVTRHNLINFFSWMRMVHPEITLSPMQEVIARALYSFGRGAGKTFLVNLLHEYESGTTQQVADVEIEP